MVWVRKAIKWAGDMGWPEDVIGLDGAELRARLAQELINLANGLHGFQWAIQRAPSPEADRMMEQVETWCQFLATDLKQEPENRGLLLYEYAMAAAGYRMLCVYCGMDDEH